MDSDVQQQQHQHHFQDLQRQFQQQKQPVNNLTRFRSAPSSYFASFLDAADAIIDPRGVSVTQGPKADLSNCKGGFFNARPLSPATENIFSRYMASMGDGSSSSSQKLSEIPENLRLGADFMARPRVKQEGDTLHHQQQEPQQKLQKQQGNYNTSSQMIYQSASKPPLANQHSSTPHIKIGIGASTSSNTSSLTRHSSSPAGFFDDLNINGYGVMGGMGNYGGCNTNNNQVNYSPGQPSTTSGLVRHNSQVGEKITRMNSLEDTNVINNQSNSNYTIGHLVSSWADSILSHSLDGEHDDTKKNSGLYPSDNQTGESRGRPPLLAHHLSLPNTSAELSAMEKSLYLQDPVPLRIRAKRGFATHPRSIAERVRRTKISDRMRRLQDLVPNMDKQTNTSDMLELAVEYIKDLQNQVKTLHCNRAKCSCRT